MFEPRYLRMFAAGLIFLAGYLFGYYIIAPAPFHVKQAYGQDCSARECFDTEIVRETQHLTRRYCGDKVALFLKRSNEGYPPEEHWHEMPAHLIILLDGSAETRASLICATLPGKDLE